MRKALLAFVALMASDVPCLAGVRIEPSTRKVLKTNRDEGLSEVILEAAGNEWVAFQVVVSADDVPLTDVDVVLSDLTGPEGAVVSASGAELSLEYYIPIAVPSPCEVLPNLTCDAHPEYQRVPGDYPDPLVPFRDPYGEAHSPIAAPFDVPANDLQTVFVDLFVPGETKPGDYQGQVSVTVGEAVLASFPVSLHVWDFSIPAKRNVATAYGLGGAIWHFHDAPDPATRDRIQRNYELAMHRHRIDPINQGPKVVFSFDQDDNLLPVDWSAYDAAIGTRIDGTYYPDGAGINRYNVGMFTPGNGHMGLSDDQWARAAAAMAEHLEEKGWLDHAYLYATDEPWLPGHDGAFQAIRDDVTLLRRYTSLWNGHVLVTSPWFEVLDGFADIWCPVTSMYDGVCWPEGSWAGREKYDELKAAGGELWFYVCNADIPPMLGYDLDGPYGYEPRILKWATWAEGATGFLFWSVTYWYDDDPWHHVGNQDAFSPAFVRNGDGILLYPGNHDAEGHGSPAHVVMDGPVVSFRLKQVRDGLEDWEMLIMADALGGGTYARDQVRRVVNRLGAALNDQFDPTDRPWTLDESVVADARRNIAAKVQYLLHPDRYHDPESPTIADIETLDDEPTDAYGMETDSDGVALSDALSEADVIEDLGDVGGLPVESPSPRGRGGCSQTPGGSHVSLTPLLAWILFAFGRHRGHRR